RQALRLHSLDVTALSSSPKFLGLPHVFRISSNRRPEYHITATITSMSKFKFCCPAVFSVVTQETLPQNKLMYLPDRDSKYQDFPKNVQRNSTAFLKIACTL